MIRRVTKKIARKLHYASVQTFASAFPKHRFKSINNELIRVEALPRYREFDTYLDGRVISGIDSVCYAAMHREILGQEIYRFRASVESPYIIDCGANIGLSVIYFKKLYPAARILAFEPDPQVFRILEGNVRNFGFGDVTLIPKGVWNSESELQFVTDMELGVGGHIASVSHDGGTLRVPVTRLRDYIVDRVDFLKVDIEGAECEVISDCADILHRVDNMFLEYHSFAGRSQCLAHLLTVLSRAGFRVHFHTIGAHSHQPFVRLESLSNGMDMQLNIFAVRPERGD